MSEKVARAKIYVVLWCSFKNLYFLTQSIEEELEIEGDARRVIGLKLEPSRDRD
jgi:hypothetical protein